MIVVRAPAMWNARRRPITPSPGSGAVQRELARLEASGLVTATRIGRQKHYQANARSPLFEELRAMALKTFALTDVLRAALDRRGARTGRRNELSPDARQGDRPGESPGPSSSG